MDASNTLTCVVVDDNAVRLATMIDEDLALTLIAVMSEDPDRWEDVGEYWPRYWTPAVCEYASGVNLLEVTASEAVQALASSRCWIALDLSEKRILTSPDSMSIARDSRFDMSDDRDANQRGVLCIHLPPWWEVWKDCQPDQLCRHRKTPQDVPYVDREVLYGEAMLDFLAQRTIAECATDKCLRGESQTGDLRQDGANCDLRARHASIVAIHRDWLLTTRDDLQGRSPRNLLHGGHDWIHRVIDGQRVRYECGSPMTAAPDSLSGYARAPMGSEETIVYFDLCRELIAVAMKWCSQYLAKSSMELEPRNTDRLVAHLRAVREVWLESPYEGGSPPRFIIECSRRRIPRGVGVEIVGMTEQESAGHFHDCDCPICNMLADGRFGVAFDFLDGHHLELDEDFAFSLCETREEWQALVDELGGFDAFDSCEGSEESPSDQCVDEYASAWTANRGDSPLPGDSTGNLKLAFLLSEIVNALQQEDDSLSVRRVNEEFSLFRRCEGNERICAAEVLKDSLEKIASQYPALLSKAADLQSRIDESLRATA